jgi:hypothetical protein
MPNTANEISRDEVAVCRRRGHDTKAIGFMADGRWGQCRWCGLWLRQITTVEEREDAPPQEEQNPMARMRGE